VFDTCNHDQLLERYVTLPGMSLFEQYHPREKDSQNTHTFIFFSDLKLYENTLKMIIKSNNMQVYYQYT